MSLTMRSNLEGWVYDLSLIQPGDVLFVRTKGLFGWLVEHKTNCRYTHTAIFTDKTKVIGALATGIREIDVRVYEGQPLRVGRPRYLPQSRIRDILAWAKAHEGRRYDFLGLVGLNFVLLLGLPNWLDRWGRWWCSEFVWDAFYYGGGVKLTDDDPRRSHVTPADLFRSPWFDLIDIHRLKEGCKVWIGV